MKNMRQQQGVSVGGLIFLLVIFGGIAVLAMKVVPAVVEFRSISKAIVSVKSSGGTVREIQGSFDKHAETGYITSISGKDLEITKNGEDVEVSFSYDKKIPLFGPVSLLIEFAGSTAKANAPKPVG